MRARLAKNWPAVRCTLGGGFRRFVQAARPAPLETAVPVFCYHVVTAEGLEADLRFLKDNGYTPISADRLLDHMTGRRRAPNKSVVLSFDDGSANLYWCAFPVLEAYDVHAVAFICPGLHRDEPDEAHHPTADNLWTDDLCTWHQLAAMQHSGHIDIQSHTLEHRLLPRWPEPVRLLGSDEHLQQTRRRATPLTVQADLALARRMLEHYLDKPVHHLAFPCMQGTRAAINAGRACGYQAFWGSVTFRRSTNQPGDSPAAVTRLNADMLYRLPGGGRRSLAALMGARFRRGAAASKDSTNPCVTDSQRSQTS